MRTRKLSRKLSLAIGAASVQSHCAKRRVPATTLPEITPVWMERLTVEKDGHLAGPHVVSHNAIRWMW